MPLAAHQRASTLHTGHPIGVSTAACGRRLGGGLAHDGLFTSLVRAPERTGDTPPRPIPLPTSLRAHDCVPSIVHVRPSFTGPDPHTSSGSVGPLKTGAEVSLGPSGDWPLPVTAVTRRDEWWLDPAYGTHPRPPQPNPRCTHGAKILYVHS